MLWLRFSFVCLTTLISLILLELSDPSVLVTEAGWWAIAALLIGYVVAIEGKQLASLGLQKPSKSTITTAAAGLGLALCGVAAFGIITAFIGLETNSTEERLDQTAAAPIWWLIIVFLRAGVIEELFFPRLRYFKINRTWCVSHYRCHWSNGFICLAARILLARAIFNFNFTNWISDGDHLRLETRPHRMHARPYRGKRRRCYRGIVTLRASMAQQ